MTNTLRFLSLCALALTSQVHAGVYIAPTDDDGSIKYSEEPMYIEVDSKRVKSFLPKQSSETRNTNIPMVGSDRLNVESAKSSDGDVSRGSGVPMRQAIEAVVPDDDWTVNFDQSVSPQKPTDWEARGDWRDILRDISKRNGVSIAVNEGKKVVGVSDDPSYARLLSAPDADVAGINAAREAGVPAVDSDVSKLGPGDMIWYIDESLTVRENLNRWAKRAEWHIDWDYPTDYEVAAPAQFVGSFKDAAKQLMFALSDAGYPIGAEVRKNHVLRIRGIK